MSNPEPVNPTNPTPSTDVSGGTPAAATSSSIPASVLSSLLQSKNTQEGPQPAPGSTPTPVIPTPSGDNSAPPPITNTTPPTKPNAPSLTVIISSILFFVLAGVAIYYGWTLGTQKGRDYLLFIQSFGPWLRSFFVRPRPVVV